MLYGQHTVPAICPNMECGPVSQDGSVHMSRDS